MLEPIVYFRLKLYSSLVALNRLVEQDVDIYDFKEEGDFTYTFKSTYRNIKAIKKVFQEVEVIRITGLIGFALALLRRKTLLFSMLLTLVLFSFASTRVCDIRVEGNNVSINLRIEEMLKENKIKRFNALPTTPRLKEVEDIVLRSLKEDIESIEIKRNGLIIKVTYQKRRAPIVIDGLTKTLVASRDGTISRFIIKRGERKVNIHDHVKRGDILVSDAVQVNDKEALMTFTSGEVYAYTWYDIEVEVPHTEKAEDHNRLIMLANSVILTRDKSLIDRIILDYIVEYNKAIMRLHYTVEENIAISIE